MATQEELLKRIALLEHKLEVVLEDRLGILEDIEAIKRLQRMYGYYIDNCLWDEMADLFADQGAEIEIGRRGRYVGKANVRKYLHDINGGGRSGLVKGQVINHTQHQGIVTVDPGRQRAHGRWRAVVQGGNGQVSGPGPGGADNKAMMYADGVYENTYLKEKGVWKIGLLFWVPTYYVSHPYSNMWYESAPPSTVFPPQQPATPPMAAIGRQFMPYHYLHPITGERVVHIAAEEIKRPEEPK